MGGHLETALIPPLSTLEAVVSFTVKLTVLNPHPEAPDWLRGVTWRKKKMGHDRGNS